MVCETSTPAQAKTPLQGLKRDAASGTIWPAAAGRSLLDTAILILSSDAPTAFQAGNFQLAVQQYLKAYEECQDGGLLSNASLAALRSGAGQAQLTHRLDQSYSVSLHASLQVTLARP